MAAGRLIWLYFFFNINSKIATRYLVSVIRKIEKVALNTCLWYNENCMLSVFFSYQVFELF